MLGTTSEHPFFAENRGWVAAQELTPEDRILSEDGRWLQVEEVYDTNEWQTVYNFTVADHHTYFVGDDRWSVWAHNAYATLSDAETYKYARKVAAVYNRNERFTWKDFEGSVGRTFTQVERVAIHQRLKASAGNLIRSYADVTVDPKTSFADFSKVAHKVPTTSDPNNTFIRLPKRLWKASDSEQFSWLDKRYQELTGTVRPEGTTWHHFQHNGQMQLVPQGVHAFVGHSGGRSYGRWVGREVELLWLSRFEV